MQNIKGLIVQINLIFLRRSYTDWGREKRFLNVEKIRVIVMVLHGQPLGVCVFVFVCVCVCV